MPVRPSILPLALALALAACSDSATDAQPNLAAEGVLVRVDSVAPALNPSTMAFAHFTVTNATRGKVWISTCVEGIPAVVQRPLGGDAWEDVSWTMCWAMSARRGLELAPGRTLSGAVQVTTAGRYRVAIPYTDGRPQDVLLLAASELFDAR